MATNNCTTKEPGNGHLQQQRTVAFHGINIAQSAIVTRPAHWLLRIYLPTPKILLPFKWHNSEEGWNSCLGKWMSNQGIQHHPGIGSLLEWYCTHHPIYSYLPTAGALWVQPASFINWTAFTYLDFPSNAFQICNFYRLVAREHNPCLQFRHHYIFEGHCSSFIITGSISWNSHPTVQWVYLHQREQYGPRGTINSKAIRRGE